MAETFDQAPDAAPDGYPKQTARFGQKRELILDAAARLFHQHGLDGVTLSDVGARVGLATNSVTYYYRRKENLVAACFERAFAAFDALIADAACHHTVEERVRSLLRGYFQLLADIEDGSRSEIVNFSSVSAVRGEAAGPVSEAYNAAFRGVRQLIDPGDGLAPGRMRLNSRTHLLFAISQWGRVWLHRYETASYVRAADHVADIFLYGLAFRPRGPLRPCPAQDVTVVAAASGMAGASVSDDAITPAHEPFLSRELFLRSATRLFNAHGIHGASVERIAANLNATKGAFYHHNTDKQEMIAACFERSFSIIRRAQQLAQSGATGKARIENAAAALVRFQLSECGPLLRITSLVALPATEAAGVLVTVNRLSERFAGFVIDGMIDGSLRPVDPTAASQIVQAMINAACSLPRWVPGMTQDEAMEHLITPVMDGICAPACDVPPQWMGPTGSAPNGQTADLDTPHQEVVRTQPSEAPTVEYPH